MLLLMPPVWELYSVQPNNRQGCQELLCSIPVGQYDDIGREFGAIFARKLFMAGDRKRLGFGQDNSIVPQRLEVIVVHNRTLGTKGVGGNEDIMIVARRHSFHVLFDRSLYHPSQETTNGVVSERQKGDIELRFQPPMISLIDNWEIPKNPEGS